MEKVKIKAIGDNIFQTKGGEEYDAIIDGQLIYVAVMSIPALSGNGASKDKPTGKSKKEEVEDDTPTPTKTKKPAGGDGKWDKVEETLKQLDKASLTGAKATARIVEDTELDEAAVKAIVTKMSKNSDYTVEEALEALKEAASGGAEEKKGPTRKTTGKGKKEETEEDDPDEDVKVKGQPKGDVIKDWKELVVGDEVSVLWNTEEFPKTWFPGEVSSKGRGGKVFIKYEDETEEELDAEAHKKIVRTKEAE